MNWRDELTAAEHIFATLPAKVARAAESAYLAGEDAQAEYRAAQGRVAHFIGQAKRLHAYLMEMRHHEHEWNEDDYCVVCGADGRA